MIAENRELLHLLGKSEVLQNLDLAFKDESFTMEEVLGSGLEHSVRSLIDLAVPLTSYVILTKSSNLSKIISSFIKW